MSNIVKKLEQSLTIKSLTDLVRVRTNERTFLLVDVSYSMNDFMRNNKRRIEALREVAANIQSQRPTPMVAFGLPTQLGGSDDQVLMSQVGFVDSVPEPSGGTPLDLALRFARENGAGRVIVISDGEPNVREYAMEEALKFGGQVDVFYVGDPGSSGSYFLDSLAKATGGQRFEGDMTEPKQLAGNIIGLLGGATEEEVDEDDDTDDEEDDEEEDDEEEDDAPRPKKGAAKK